VCLLRDGGTSEDPGFKSSCFILLAQKACKCSWCSTCYLFFAGGTTSEYPVHSWNVKLVLNYEN